MKLLEQLCKTPGVPGREHRVRQVIQNEAESLFDEVYEDPMGSLICTRQPRTKAGKVKKPTANTDPTRVMLAAHMDQIGFIVSHVDERGFIRLNPVGGFDPRNLFARLITICPDPNDPKRDITGVLNPAIKPIHMAKGDERNKVPEIAEFAVDLGLPGDEVNKKVKVGDMAVLNAPFEQVGNTVVSQALDNRTACWILLRAMQKLDKANTGHDAEISAVFTCQEEVGLRGARTSSYAVDPDIGIAVDTTLCVDTPGTEIAQSPSKQGEGAGITCLDASSIGDYDLIEQFESIGRKHKVKHQRCASVRGGTDSGTMQFAREGVRTLTLSCPTRYIHTVTEMVHRDDLDACRDLLAAYLGEVK